MSGTGDGVSSQPVNSGSAAPNTPTTSTVAQAQSFQQQLLRKPETNDPYSAFQAGGLHGVLSGGPNFALNSMQQQQQQQQQSRKFIDMFQQQQQQQQQHHGSPHIRDESQSRTQHGFDQQMINPLQQAYMQYAYQAVQQQKSGTGMPPQQQMKMGMVGSSGKDLISFQSPNQSPAQAQSSKKPAEPASSDSKPANGPILMQGNMMRPIQGQAPQSQQAMTAQMQALQALVQERNIDMSNPANANYMAQYIPLMQSRLNSQQQQQQKVNENNFSQPSSQPANESSPRGNSSSELSGQSGPAKVRPSGSSGQLMNNTGKIPGQQFNVRQQSGMVGNGAMSSMHPPTRLSMNLNQGGADHPGHGKSVLPVPEPSQMQYGRPPNCSSPQPTTSSTEGGLGNNPFSSQGGGTASQVQKSSAFSKQQLHVLKAQILAFRRLKKGDGTLPRELLLAIVPPPLETQSPQQGTVPPGPVVQEKSIAKNVQEPNSRHLESSEKDPNVLPPATVLSSLKGEPFVGDEKASTSAVNSQSIPAPMKEQTVMSTSRKEEQQNHSIAAKLEPEAERAMLKTPPIERGKAVVPQASKPVPPSSVSQPPKDAGASRKYHGPLFDFPFFTKKHDTFGSAMTVNNNNNLTLAYDVKDLLHEEGMEVLGKKRAENIKKIGGLLAFNLERKRIRPDLVLRLQIEEKKLKLLDRQARLRDEVDQQQQDIMAMPDRPYRKFVRLCERQRMELNRQVHLSQKAGREKQLKSIFQWRKKLLEAHWAIRDARTSRNRGVAKYHERMLREFSKRKDDDRNKRMEALKNNDVERYREMLLEQQTSIPGEAAERYAVLSSFLSQTEEYLHKLGSKITAAKNQQEVEEAANSAAAAARSQGLSEEEVRTAASCAGEEVMIRNRFSQMNTPKESSSVNKYYNLAHAVNERVMRQPSMLRKGTLRDYQLVGLQWMLSLYNNKLNGILADEMGLGKTVQVMALIAYLMEFKGNYGPHLIIVPNAVLVNWKSELHTWLPSVSCIYYVGTKDTRSKLFTQEVCAMKFNVLVTTYEFIMYDRSKLSKVDWKYIIIDEAQRMKDRESVLARDLDRYRCQRRLLLTGTPLQNDLKELWSLLNLLLPEVFDNRKAFHDWFAKPFQREGSSHNAEDDWLETEKKVIIIHRLHQILEPFMLRRRVEDVEGSLPPKVSIILRCRMSAIQSAVYDWIKSTGTIRVDPEDEKLRCQRSSIYQAKVYKTLNNRCMELRKTCNHPLLNYPFFNDLSKDFLVRSCGKLFVLDRILIKLQRTGHRVLLFSTMTKLLDILEEYLQWRRLVYRRIDGTTSLEDRESAIVDFNSPDTDCFIFLLSIRAAGRGLNLQSADTVIIYDPDPNPKNEEQAVARAHRIGQKREVKVIYMEAVVDKVASHQKEDEFKSSGAVDDSDDDLAGKNRYIGSIEGLIRNNIQQYKIDMADEVINAGRFDQRTTHEERRLTLETLLHDDERYQETVHDVPSLQEVNRLIARSEEEVEMFDQMDEEFDWAEEMTRYDQVPKWLRASTKEVNTTIAKLSKKTSKNILGTEASEVPEDLSLKKRGRPKGKKYPVYKEVDESDAFSSEEEKNHEDSAQEEEIEELEEVEEEVEEEEEEEEQEEEGEEVEEEEEQEEFKVSNEQSEEERVRAYGEYEYSRTLETNKNNININNNRIAEEAASSGSSGIRKVVQIVSPSISSQKFGSLSALDARPGSLSKRLPDDLEEGEIAMSGDSPMELQQSNSWIQEREEGEDEQVLQPKIKRKRSIRVRPRIPTEKLLEEKSSVHRVNSSHLPFQANHKYDSKLRTAEAETSAYNNEQSDSSLKNRRNLPTRQNTSNAKMSTSLRSSRPSAPLESGVDHARERSWDSKVAGTRMSDGVQRRCKSVISKFQRRIDKEGNQIVPLLTDLWKRTESGSSNNNILDIRKIDQRIDRFEYAGVMELVSDVQLMLKSAVQYYGFSHEVRSEARKVHDLFFDILKIAFPDMDFREARNAVSFTGQIPSTSTPAPPPRQSLPSQSQSRRQKLINMERDPSPPAPKKLLSRGPVISDDARITRAQGAQLPQRETRLGSSSSSRDLQPQDNNNPRLFAHPGELVICKKKRKDREKSVMMKSVGGSGGPVSPLGRTIKSPGSGSGSGLRDTRLSQQMRSSSGGGSGGGSPIGWANPVKRMRTDAGKRRPSHL